MIKARQKKIRLMKRGAMSKKTNTFIFIIAATLFNIFVVVLFFCVLTLLYVKFLMPYIPGANSSWGFMFIFIFSIVISFLIYRLALKIFLKKVNVEKYFEPVFTVKNK